MPNRIDALVSHGLGKVHAVKARFHGLVGVFRLLSEQHGEVSGLMRRCMADPARRAELWPKIKVELVSHERAELRELYPLLLADRETRAFAEHHAREATELETLIDELDVTEFGASTWAHRFDQLVAMVEQHAHEEESTIFAKAQEVIGEARAKVLEPLLLATKKAIARAVDFH